MSPDAVPDDRPRLADFIAREAERLNTPPIPRFAKPRRAIYGWGAERTGPEGWRSWTEFTRYGEGFDG